MKTPARRLAPTFVVETVLTTLLAEGADLKAVTLDEFKDRMTQTIRRMTDDSKAIAA